MLRFLLCFVVATNNLHNLHNLIRPVVILSNLELHHLHHLHELPLPGDLVYVGLGADGGARPVQASALVLLETPEA